MRNWVSIGEAADTLGKSIDEIVSDVMAGNTPSVLAPDGGPLVPLAHYLEHSVTVTEVDRLTGDSWEEVLQLHEHIDTDGEQLQGLWSISLVSSSRDRIHLMERRDGNIQAYSDFVERTRLGNFVVRKQPHRQRISTSTKSRIAALDRAHRWIVEWNRQRWTRGEVSSQVIGEDDPKNPTLGTLVAVYRKHLRKMPCSLEVAGHQLAALEIAATVLGEDKRAMTIDSEDLRFIYAKRCGKDMANLREDYAFDDGDGPGIALLDKYHKRYKYLPPIKPITARKTLEALRTALMHLSTWVKEGGRHPLMENPLEGKDFGKAKRGRRPTWDARRFKLTMMFVDQVDPTGVLRFFLSCIYYGGLRVGTVLIMQPSHFLSREYEIRRAFELIASNGTYFSDDEVDLVKVAPKAWAEGSAHGGKGAIFLDHLKTTNSPPFQRVIPVSPALARERDYYWERCQKRKVNSPWVFFSGVDPESTVKESTLCGWLREAEALALEHAVRCGMPRDEAEGLLGEVWNNAFQPYRKLWENHRDASGWHNNKNSAYLCGWSTHVPGGGAQANVYRDLNAMFILGCAQGRSVLKLVKEVTGNRAEAEMQMEAPRAPEQIHLGGPREGE
jgi:hypothetical protein